MKLTVVMLNTYPAEMAIQHFNESRPFTRRTVQIELTPGQVAEVSPRHVGTYGGGAKKFEYHEEIERCWIEPEEEPGR